MPKDFTAARSILKGFLLDFAQRTGDARALLPFWREAVGEAIARRSAPVTLEGSVLRIRVEEGSWQRELEGRESELLARLEAVLERASISQLTFDR